MTDEPTIQECATEACPRCRQDHYADALKPLWRVPRYLVALKVGGQVREEVYGHYCPRCRRTMNISVTTFGVMIIMALLALVLA